MSKKLGIMQPYFLPYMGYWQLIEVCDEFVLYDNIEYTKKGWINRNRFLQNGKDVLFTLPLRSGSDYLKVSERYLSNTFDRKKLARQLQEAYRKAPHFAENFYLFEEIINCPEENLFAYIENSIRKICDYLDITTPFMKSSDIEIDHKLKAKEKVFEICKARDAQDYINPIGGVELYDKQDFKSYGINLSFLKSHALGYQQFGQTALPYLSIIDVMMFNSRSQTIQYLKKEYHYE